MVQRLLDASASLPAFIHDLLTQQALTVAATEAAAFLVEQQGESQTLRNIAHIRPDNATAEVRQAALEAFQDLVRPCLAQGKEGIIELGNPGENGEPQFCLVTPLRADGQVVAVTAVITRCMNTERAKQRLMSMQLVAGYFDLYQMRRNNDQARLMAQNHQSVLQFANAVANSTGFQQACLNLCNELAGRTQATRVSLGWVKNHRVKVQALSHTEEFDKKQELVVQIEGAMEECLDQEQYVQFATDGNTTQNVTRSAQLLSRQQGGNTVLSLPMRRQSDIIGVVTLEFLPGVKISPAMAQQLAVAIDLIAPQLYDRWMNDRYLITKAGISARETAKMVVGPKHMLGKLIAILVIAGLLFVCLYSPMYRVSAPFKLVSIQPRSITMPFDEQIEQVHVKLGDKVTKGQLLIELRSFELKNRHAAAMADAQKSRKEADEKQMKGEIAAANALREAYKKAMADVELLGKQVEETRITAPFDGVILTGDIEDKINTKMERGKPLLQMAPEGNLKAEIRVSDTDIQKIWEPKPDGRRQAGQIATNSDPRSKYSVTIERIVPLPTPDKGVNSFPVYATLGKDVPANWKPGMEGEARIDVEHRPLIYIWTHRLADFIRLKLWM
jgi:multidrug efflux pump subunit AcrA (membrane-fusion protein)